ncbi:MAG: hypothetical protein IPK27_22160 [Rhodanobacteraceae bacterium]|nr:hypothetical protein [Rhodanobacteraceae bacterium]
MLHEPVHQQLARLGLRGVADTLARMSPGDEFIDTLATLLEAECLHRDSVAQTRRLACAPQPAGTPADVDLRSRAVWARAAGSICSASTGSGNTSTCC